jgi:lipid A oxidase
MLKSIATASKAAIAALFVSAAPAAAEIELSFYLGAQSVQKSNLSGTIPNPAGAGAPVAVNRRMDWEANPFDMPVYWGARGTYWLESNWGFGLEYTHAKAYASNADKAALGLAKFELSDGHNLLTLNAMRRFPGLFGTDKVTPYAGGGIGFAFPHVDVQSATGGLARTFGYEVTGPAVRGIIGLNYRFTERWSLFSEYQITYSENDITVDPFAPGQAAGKVSTDITTHALNVGVSYSF